MHGSTPLKLIPTAMIFGTCSDRQGVCVNNGCSQIIPFKKVREYSVQIPVRGKLKLSSVTDNNLINSNNSINNNTCNEKKPLQRQQQQELATADEGLQAGQLQGHPTGKFEKKT